MYFEQIMQPEIGIELTSGLTERHRGPTEWYTGLRNAGLREGDRAPITIVELVDGPFDLRKHFSVKQSENRVKQ